MKIAQRLYIDLLKNNNAGILKFLEGGSKQWIKTTNLWMSSSFYISSAGHYWQYRAENKTIHMLNKLVFWLVYMLHQFKFSNLDRPTLKMNVRCGYFLAIHLVISVYFPSTTLGGWIVDARAVHGRGIPPQNGLRLMPSEIFFYKLCIAIQ